MRVHTRRNRWSSWLTTWQRALAASSMIGLALAFTGPTAAQSVSPPINLGPGLATGVNDAGDVVGASRPEGLFRATLWTAAGDKVDLGTLATTLPGPRESVAEDVNNRTEVVGWSRKGPEVHAFRWTRADGLIDLGTLGGTDSGANAVDDAGNVVGNSATASGNWKAFLWTPTAGLVALPLDSANDISNARQVVGESVGHAVMWTEIGGVRDLGTLGGARSYAYGINDVGQVVGGSQTASGGFRFHAFLWSAADGMKDLGTLGGDDSSAYAVNRAGHVVGSSTTATGEIHAFLWTPTSGMVDLGAPVGGTSDALDINEAGWVVGDGITGGGEIRAMVWRTCVASVPTIAEATATPSVLWPPNHKMVRVRVDYTVATSCGATATTTLSIGIKDREHGHGEGHVSDDAVVIDAHTVLLRAARSGRGHGRTYTIWIRAVDSTGLEAIKALTVTVPKSRGHDDKEDRPDR